MKKFWLAALFSIAIKLFLASLGHNYDLESYELVAGLVHDGKSVYAHTIRYNYGPIWFLMLGGIQYLAEHLPLSAGRENFHLWVALLLAFIDIALALSVRAMGYPRAAVLFLLCPVSWLITGFHSQFDQMPVAAALPAVFLLGQAHSPKRNLFFAALLLGLSLTIKHSLIFFPLWLALWLWNARRPAAAAILCFLPPLLFLLSFLPWALDPDSRAGIIHNVFQYKSDDLYALVPKVLTFLRITPVLESAFSWVPIFSGYKFVWAAGMAGLGFFFRRRSPLELLLLYTVSLIVLTPALSDQYLVIPLLACAFYWQNPWIKGYVILSTLFLLFFSPANVGTIAAMHGITNSLSFLPVRRYFAVAFLFVFLIQEIRRGQKIHSPKPA